MKILIAVVGLVTLVVVMEIAALVIIVFLLANVVQQDLDGFLELVVDHLLSAIILLVVLHLSVVVGGIMLIVFGQQVLVVT